MRNQDIEENQKMHMLPIKWKTILIKKFLKNFIIFSL